MYKITNLRKIYAIYTDSIAELVRLLFCVQKCCHVEVDLYSKLTRIISFKSDVLEN